MLSKFNIFVFAALCLLNFVLADVWRFSIADIHCIETREWDTDHLHVFVNVVAGSQNVSKEWIVLNNTHDGTNLAFDQSWINIPLSGTEPDLTAAFGVFNIGDSEKQDIALKITSSILEIPKRIPVLGGIAAAIDAFVSFFKGAYHCEGLVAVNAARFSKQLLFGMKLNEEQCDTRKYTYTTGPGCVDVNPTTTKVAVYEVKVCIQRLSGDKVATGGIPIPNAGQSFRYNGSSLVFYFLAVAAAMFLVA